MTLQSLAVSILASLSISLPPEPAMQSAGKTTKPAAPATAAPQVSMIQGERVKPEEAMTFTRSVLLKEGQAYALMNEIPENISSVHFSITNYRAGYSLPATKEGERFVFSGPTKAWRAESTADQSIWPPVTHLAVRREAMRRAKLLHPIALAEPVDEMNNLRVYYLPNISGFDGKQYIEEPMAIAFFMHPATGRRMTVLIRGGRTYGTVDRPLASTSGIYVHNTTRQSAGPLGLAQAHIPNIFYSKTLELDMLPFAQGDPFDKLMSAVLDAHQKGPLSTETFRALYQEMTRYTSAPVQ